jgi:hypothetical protein
MERRRVRELIAALRDLSHEQALAIDADRLEAVAFVASRMEEALDQLASAETGLLQECLEHDPALRREVERLARVHSLAQSMLRLAQERIGLRRAGLSGTGMHWYGDRPRPRLRCHDLDVTV